MKFDLIPGVPSMGHLDRGSWKPGAARSEYTVTTIVRNSVTFYQVREDGYVLSLHSSPEAAHEAIRNLP